MRPGVESHQTALDFGASGVQYFCFPGSVLPSCPHILAVRVGETYLHSLRAHLLSSTLVSPVMFGYQCFIFINREFSNIAYYIHKYIYAHICKQINTASHSVFPRQPFNLGDGGGLGADL